jgi:hypothetical protein
MAKAHPINFLSLTGLQWLASVESADGLHHKRREAGNLGVTPECLPSGRDAQK